MSLTEFTGGSQLFPFKVTCMQNKANLSTLIKALISLGLIWLLLQKVDLYRIIQAIKSCNWQYLCLALSMFVLSKIISSIRLNLFFKVSGINMSEALNLKLYLLGMFYNLFLPGGIGGDGYKVYFIRKYLDKTTRNVITPILLDRISGLFILCYLATVLSLFIDYFRNYASVILVIILVSLPMYYLIQKKFFPIYSSSFIHASLMSAGVQIAQLFSAYFILCALKHSPDYVSYLFVFLVSSIVAVIPVTIGGIGAREFSFFIGSKWLHMNMNSSIALSLIFFSITAVVSLCGITYSIKGLRINKDNPVAPSS